MHAMTLHRAIAVASSLLCLILHLFTASAKRPFLDNGEPRAEGGRILLATILARGHMGPAMALAVELASRGYRITFAIPYKKGVADHYFEEEIFTHPNITLLPLPLPDVQAEILRSDLRLLAKLNPQEVADHGLKILLESSLDSVEPLRHEIRYYKPDLFICDVVVTEGILVGKENPDLPFVRLSTTMIADSSSKKFLPFLNLDFPVRMNTWQRFVSYATAKAFESELLFMFGPLGKFQKKVKEMGLPPFRSYKSLRHGPVIVQSMMGLEPPHRIDPGHTFVGPITMPKRVDDLPEDLRQWLDERDNVVYVTIATTNAASKRFWAVMVHGIQMLPNITVLLAVRGLNKDHLPSPLPANILQLDWVPQLAVLVHPSVKAMVNSAGMNSIGEGIAAAVPQILFPFHSDQFLNAFSLERAGAALKLDKTKFMPNDIANAILRVTREESFRVQSQRLMLIQRAAGGVQSAADVAELYLRLGAQGMELLKDATEDLWWHERTGADIVLLQVAIVLFFVWAVLRRFGYRARLPFEGVPTKEVRSVVEPQTIGHVEEWGRQVNEKGRQKGRRRFGNPSKGEEKGD